MGEGGERRARDVKEHREAYCVCIYVELYMLSNNCIYVTYIHIRIFSERDWGRRRKVSARRKRVERN